MNRKNIAVTVDTIILSGAQHDDGHLLLIQRKNEPFKGQWAFPGGFVDEEEDLKDAAVRELKEETGLEVNPRQMKQIGAFGKPGRDPRGHTVTVVYLVLIPGRPAIKGADDAAEAKWWPLEDLPTLAFDHFEILQEALKDRGYNKKG